MRALAVNVMELRRRPSDAVAVAAAALYVGSLASLLAGGPFHPSMFVALPLPLLLIPLVSLRRQPLPPLKAQAMLAAGVALGAYVGALVVPGAPLVALGLPLILVAGIVAARRPVEVFVVALFCTGSFGSLQALADVPAARVADVMLLGLWIAAIWGWWFGRHVRSRFMPSLFALGLYVVFSAGEIFTADNLTAGFQAFRGSMWYLAVLLLVANAPWTDAVRERMLRGAVLVGLAVGAYATLRWAIGPAGAERALAETNANNFLDGELRPTGSFATSKELAFWTALMTPFLFALGLAWRGRWRVIAMAGASVCVVGMLAADVRAGPAAAAPAMLVVLALYQLSQGYRGRRGPAVMVIVLATLLIGGGAFAVTIGDKQDTADRYENILNPTRDASFQARLSKWRAALDDIDNAPLGYGLGTAGRSQKRFGVYANIATYDVDNSYLVIAYQQGFVVMLLLVAILLAILTTIARGAITDPDPARAGPLIAACGTLVAMLIIFYVGDYIEGLPALGGWLLVGLGVAQLKRVSVAREP